MVRLDLLASGCQPGAHMGELYVDGVGTTIPGLFASGTGPAQVNSQGGPPPATITYTINYKNGSPPVACSATSPFYGCAAAPGPTSREPLGALVLGLLLVRRRERTVRRRDSDLQ